MKKSTKIFRTICLLIFTVGILSAGFLKLIGNVQEVQMFSAVHLESTIIIIGILEVLVAAGVWWKKTRTLATLFGTAIMGAAVAETISLGMPSEIIAPGIILLLLWTVFFIDHCGCHCDCAACKNCSVNPKA